MPNQPSPDTARLIVLLPKDLLARLRRCVAEKNRMEPGGNFSASSIARQAILEKVEEIERQAGISPSPSPSPSHTK